MLSASTAPVLALTLTLALILIVLRVPAEIPLTSPLLPVARIMRMVGCIIHSIFTLCSLALPDFGTRKPCCGFKIHTGLVE